VRRRPHRHNDTVDITDEASSIGASPERLGSVSTTWFNRCPARSLGPPDWTTPAFRLRRPGRHRRAIDYSRRQGSAGPTRRERVADGVAIVSQRCKPRNVPWQDRTSYTGIWKATVAGARNGPPDSTSTVTGRAIERHAAKQGAAVMVTQIEIIRLMAEALRPRMTFGPAVRMNENLTSTVSPTTRYASVTATASARPSRGYQPRF